MSNSQNVRRSLGSRREQWVESRKEKLLVFVQNLRADEDPLFVDALNSYASKTLTSLCVRHAIYLGIDKEDRSLRHEFIEGSMLSSVWAHVDVKARSVLLRKLHTLLKCFYADFRPGIRPPDVERPTPWKNDVIAGLFNLGSVCQHNDMNSTNLIANLDKSEIAVIDYETLGLSFVGRDHASLFIDPQIDLTENEIEFLLRDISPALTPESIALAVAIEGRRKLLALQQMGEHDLGVKVHRKAQSFLMSRGREDILSIMETT